MKRMGKLLLGTAVLLALLAVIYCLIPGEKTREDARPPTTSTVSREDERSREPRPLATTNSAVVEFASWTKKYLAAATAPEREGLLSEGEDLAKVRRAE